MSRAKPLPPNRLAPLPDSFDRWNPAMRGAFLKGRAAFIEGLGQEACPYQDLRKHDGRLTWSRAFERAWIDGWIDQKNFAAGSACEACKGMVTEKVRQVGRAHWLCASCGRDVSLAYLFLCEAMDRSEAMGKRAR